ncbi:MAG: L-histidine N(alpha)-methyltransferase [bacterium]|nr:L-histidine N(alpha)-methyltransferase [bacterium]
MASGSCSDAPVAVRVRADGYSISVCTDEAVQDRALAADVSAGLRSIPKDLPPKWFYDDEGSRLFGAITRLPEYYPTRREHEILQRAAPEIATLSGAGTLVELGSGFSHKTRLLLDAMAAAGTLEGFVPFDVNQTALRATAAAAVEAYPDVAVHGVVGDFGADLRSIPGGDRRLVALLGGTIGNFPGPERRKFLAEIASLSSAGETFLLGADLVKDRSRLLAAYDDDAGVTAAFNRNVLGVINRRLDADFEPRRFTHVVTYDEETQRIEMWLRSDGAQEVYVRRLDLRVSFDDGEAMRTEISAKFRPTQIGDELEAAGFSVLAQWLDAAGDFSLTLARRGDGPPP